MLLASVSCLLSPGMLCRNLHMAHSRKIRAKEQVASLLLLWCDPAIQSKMTSHAPQGQVHTVLAGAGVQIFWSGRRWMGGRINPLDATPLCHASCTPEACSQTAWAVTGEWPVATGLSRGTARSSDRGQKSNARRTECCVTRQSMISQTA